MLDTFPWPLVKLVTCKSSTISVSDLTLAHQTVAGACVSLEVEQRLRPELWGKCSIKQFFLNLLKKTGEGMIKSMIQSNNGHAALEETKI